MLFSTTVGANAVDSVLRVKPTGLGMEIVEREPQVYGAVRPAGTGGFYGLGNVIPTSTVTNLPVAPYGVSSPNAYNQAGVGFRGLGLVEMQPLSGFAENKSTWLLIGGGVLAAVGGWYLWRKRQQKKLGPWRRKSAITA
jgi:LPXTG-motif cell wall-anchored protein